MTQEESHPDQEGHADNRRRCQSGQVTEQGTPLSGRPAGLPARTRPCSPPTLIGVTADEHWVIPRAPTYALLLIANQRPTAPSPLRGGTTSGGGSPYLGRAAGVLPAPHESAAGKTAGTRRHTRRGRGRPPGSTAGRTGYRPGPGPGTGRRAAPGYRPGARPGSAPKAHRGPEAHPGCPVGAASGAARTPARGFRPGAGPAAGRREDRPRDRPHGLAEAIRPRAPTPNHVRGTGRRGRIPDVAGESAAPRCGNAAWLGRSAGPSGQAGPAGQTRWPRAGGPVPTARGPAHGPG